MSAGMESTSESVVAVPALRGAAALGTEVDHLPSVELRLLRVGAAAVTIRR